MTTTILLTGFEPFGGESVNPSWEIARALDGWACEGRTVRAVQLPCAFGDALGRLDEALAAHRPELVVCLGQAGGRTEISLERAALNVDDARIPDNLGRQQWRQRPNLKIPLQCCGHLTELPPCSWHSLGRDCTAGAA